MKVPTTAEQKAIKTEKLGVLRVRRVSRSQFTTILGAIGYNGEAHSKAALAQTLVQWAITGRDDGEMETKRHPVLGKMASDAIYDALSDEEAVAIFQYAHEGTELPEAMRGN